jgi:hypothetical protein
VKIFLVLAALLLTGCASTLSTAPTTTQKVGEDPPLNITVTKSVGDVIYATFNYEQATGARLQAPVKIDVLAAQATIPDRSFLESFKDSAAAAAYCTKDLALSVTFNGPMSRVCLADMDSNGKFDSWRAPEGPPARRSWAKLVNEVPFVIEGETSATTGGFRYELIYQGIAGNVVSLLYREYINDLARPAFQQDLSYTLSSDGPTEVSFRGTKIRVHSADNNSIKYEVLSGLRKGGSG